MNTTDDALIAHMDELTPYSPPDHSGTTNVRLVEAGESEHFEMVHGRIAPGGEAERHWHRHNYQAIFVLAGEAHVELDDQPPKRCGAGNIIRIPPGTEHYLRSIGEQDLCMTIVYAPPLDRT